MTKIACLIATWHDEQLLADAVASAAPHVDVVIVLDGAYAGLDVDESSSSTSELGQASRAGAIVVDAPLWGGLWPGEIEKRNVLLELGRCHLDADLLELGRGYLGAGGGTWALVLDADEVLVGGELLRPLLEQIDPEAFAPGLPRLEPNGDVYHAPSRLFRLSPWVRYLGRSYNLCDPSSWKTMGVDLSHYWTPGPAMRPYVEHRWDRRSPARLEVQRAWGRELAERDR